ncbi:MAG: response regulator transcription factor [Chloroflexota bacterium]|nr:response regulator transcription factor [Chloroflexota bacterium]
MAHERILVIEDDPAVARAIRFSLAGYGFEVASASTAAEGQKALEGSAPSLVLLDLGLPDMDGLDLCAQIRAQSNVPIIILTARGAEHEKIIALEGGADDYITKPFGMGELLARIRVALRHAAQTSPSGAARIISVGELVINLDAHQVVVRGQLVHLTPTEFKLLGTLARNSGRMSTHQMLLREVWGLGYGADTQLLRLFISQIRAKVEQDPTEPIYIVTEPGVGYRFALADEQ